MTFGVGVEGPSDFHFWNKVLHKHFRSCQFDVRNMKNRDKLIRETPRLLESFRDSHYAAGFILVDLDDDPCIASVLDLFDATIRQVARQGERTKRFLHICVAIREIESWYLADAEAIDAVIPGCAWQAPADTGAVDKGKLRALVRSHFGRNSTFNELAFAKDIAPKFSPKRARSHSMSFHYFWGILEGKARP